MKSNIYSRITSKILIAVLMLSCIAIVACTDGNNGLEYKVNSDGKTCTITGLGTYSSKDLVIPSHIGGYKVTAIADHAFQGTDIETFSGADSITTIGKYAFQGCKQLRTVRIPEGVIKIREYCFDYCESLSSVTFPKNLQSLEYAAFSYCESLITINLPEKVVKIGDYSFTLCQRLTSINIPNTVKEIGDFAFTGCQSLQELTLPDSLMTIGQSAFAVCLSLTKIYLPASVIKIGAAPLVYTNLTTIDVDVNNPVLSSIDGHLYSNNGTILVNYACGKSDISFNIPYNVTQIGQGSFSGCLNLKTISIPRSVNYIGRQIFYASSNIEALYYDGTVEDWNKIEKEADWNKNTESVFTIICTDGTIAMDGTVTYN